MVPRTSSRLATSGSSVSGAIASCAAAVTTRGLAYYMTATDGFTNTAAPGTFSTAR